jgi:hypothetical protein
VPFPSILGNVPGFEDAVDGHEVFRQLAWDAAADPGISAEAAAAPRNRRHPPARGRDGKDADRPRCRPGRNYRTSGILRGCRVFRPGFGRDWDLILTAGR